jgi:hypothetical protein
VHAADYGWSLRGLDGAAYAEEKSACHLRSARKLVDLAFKNGAIYIKAGQHIGQLVSCNVGLHEGPRDAAAERRIWAP